MTVPHPASVDKEGSKAPSTDGHEVRLLQTVKVPARQQKLVRATIGEQLVKGPMIFTPSEVTGDLQMADSVVEMGNDKFVTLILQNHGTERVHLKKGLQFGVVSPTTVLTDSDQVVGTEGRGAWSQSCPDCSKKQCIHLKRPGIARTG